MEVKLLPMTAVILAANTQWHQKLALATGIWNLQWTNTNGLLLVERLAKLTQIVPMTPSAVLVSIQAMLIFFKKLVVPFWDTGLQIKYAVSFPTMEHLSSATSNWAPLMQA
jgi:hypothetical protein